ncbi:MAG TPA: formate--tetrahydrofolate ligase [Chitinophagaceae bacterium]|nr:formate--tetrahydrofolate ligase [Chitinophagaceae bacterium]
MIDFPPDIEIAQSAPIRHIRNIAAKLGISDDQLEYYGKYKAKLPLSLINEEKIAQHHLILVTAITPTAAGEGKTTISIGLTDGLNKIGMKAMAVLREPSLGPVFGMKGGAAGGGFAQVIPMEDINLHFTGDFAAVETANNLLSAIIDNHLQHDKNGFQIDPRTIVWKRVMDMNDRALRNIIVGLGGPTNGVPRQDGFNITPASEIMAILCLAKDFEDLKCKLGNIYIASTYSGEPVFARDVKAVGAMAVLLKDAIKPNLVQTLEANPVILHGGPFASIAQGTNSILGTKMGLSLADYVVTEAGFGADLGAEKFFDIKCVSAGLNPEAVVIVVTARAMRYHGGAKKAALAVPNSEAVQKGLRNLEKHIENIRKFNLNPVVAINAFADDSEEEIDLIKEFCASVGTKAIVATAFSDGGDGALELATEVVNVIANNENKFQPLYNWNISIEEKIHCLATEIYGAKTVEYSVKARQGLRLIKELGFDHMPVCMAKTPKSLSDDDRKLGRPKDFIVTVREFEFASGAGFVIPILGDIMRMPGLPATPAAENVDIDSSGKIVGLF